MSTTWTILSLVLGLAGLGGAGFLAFALITGGIAVPLALGGAVQALRGLWAFANSTVGRLVMVALLALGMFIGGDVHATRRERRACEQRIQASIEANKKFDKQLSDEQHAKAQQQQAEADQRVAAAEQRVADYEEKYKSCDVGDAADWLNDDGGVRPQPGRAIPKPPKPPRRP